MTDEDVVERLAEALEAEEARPQQKADPHAIIETQNWIRYARTLLPVVREIVDQWAAEIPNGDCTFCDGTGWIDSENAIEHRAAALRREAGR